MLNVLAVQGCTEKAGKNVLASRRILQMRDRNS